MKIVSDKTWQYNLNRSLRLRNLRHKHVTPRTSIPCASWTLRLDTSTHSSCLALTSFPLHCARLSWDSMVFNSKIWQLTFPLDWLSPHYNKTFHSQSQSGPFLFGKVKLVTSEIISDFLQTFWIIKSISPLRNSYWSVSRVCLCMIIITWLITKIP